MPKKIYATYKIFGHKPFPNLQSEINGVVWAIYVQYSDIKGKWVLCKPEQLLNVLVSFGKT